jgi:hypothetical protein
MLSINHKRLTEATEKDLDELCNYLDYLTGGPEITEFLAEILYETDQDFLKLVEKAWITYTPRYGAITIWSLLMNINSCPEVKSYRRMTAS